MKDYLQNNRSSCEAHEGNKTLRVLHYALGFPPYRSGGLTKYCIDLLKTQKERGYEVAMMWPGKFCLSGHFVRFKKSKKEVGNAQNSIKIDSFEMINPLPVPLDEGISNIELYTSKCPNVEAFNKLLERYRPDVIHIHTWMGLYKEFLEIAKQKNIKIVFTTHDFFGICPKVTLFRGGYLCDGDCDKCADCNQNAMSLGKIKILQSKTYQILKNSYPVKLLRKRHRQHFFDTEDISINKDLGLSEEQRKNNREDYLELRDYYISMLEMVDEIHFNSTVTEGVYKTFLPKLMNSKTISISHRDISDQRCKKNFSGKLKITYLSQPKALKGFDIMKQALDELWEEGIRRFELNIYQGYSDSQKYIRAHEKFSYSELKRIFSETDLLIASSVGYDTFGFTVLEALSFGVPVLVSTNVGCKDLLEGGYYGMVIKPTKNDIKQAIKYIIEHRELLAEYNRRIVEEMDLEAVIHFADEIEKMYLRK